jgi:hypothetical protein
MELLQMSAQTRGLMLKLMLKLAYIGTQSPSINDSPTASGIYDEFWEEDGNRESRRDAKFKKRTNKTWDKPRK